MLKLDLSKNIICIMKCIMKLYYEKLQMCVCVRLLSSHLQCI